jgi:hypothetical protein
MKIGERNSERRNFERGNSEREEILREEKLREEILRNENLKKSLELFVELLRNSKKASKNFPSACHNNKATHSFKSSQQKNTDFTLNKIIF